MSDEIIALLPSDKEVHPCSESEWDDLYMNAIREFGIRRDWTSRA